MLGREKEGDMGGQGEKNVGGEKGHGFLEGDGGGGKCRWSEGSKWPRYYAL